MFQKGDHVTIEIDGAHFAGEFVRYYGDKVQIRQADGKLTGKVASVKIPREAVIIKPVGGVTRIPSGAGHEVGDINAEKGRIIPLKTQSIMPRPAKPAGESKLGKCQHAVIEYLRMVPNASFRQIATSCEVSIPRAATIVKSLVIKGVLVKTSKEGRNHYECKA